MKFFKYNASVARSAAYLVYLKRMTSTDIIYVVHIDRLASLTYEKCRAALSSRQELIWFVQFKKNIYFEPNLIIILFKKCIDCSIDLRTV